MQRPCGELAAAKTGDRTLDATGHKTHVHHLLAHRLAALVLTTLLALSVGHVLFNAGLDQMS